MPLEPREFFEQIFMALTVGGSELAKQLPNIASSHEAQGAIAVLAPTLGFALGRGVYDVFSSRKKLLADGYVKAFNNNPNKAKEHAEQQKDNPDYHETMFQIFRRLMVAVDPSVVETLGYLAGQYNWAEKRADSHFRHLGRLLCELEPGELDDLKKLLNGVVTAIFEFRNKDYEDLSLCREDFYVTWSDKKQRPQVEMYTGYSRYMGLVESIPSAERLFWLLKSEGFSETLPENDKVVSHQQKHEHDLRERPEDSVYSRSKTGHLKLNDSYCN